MTFLEFCEEINGRPLASYQRDFIEAFEEAKEKGISLNAMPVVRGTGRFSSVLLCELLYEAYEKNLKEENK